MDGAHLCLGEQRIHPVIEEEGTVRRKLPQPMHHVLGLTVKGTPHTGIGPINLRRHIVVIGGEQIIVRGRRIQDPEPARMAAQEAAVPVVGDVGRLQGLPDGRLRSPEITGNAPPAAAEQQGTVGEQGDVRHLRIPVVGNGAGTGRHGKGTGGISGDQELVGIRKILLADAKRRLYIGGSMAVQDLRIAVDIGIRDLTVSDVKIAGGIGDHQKIPVPKGVVGGICLCDARIDVHELGDGPEIVPVKIGLTGSHAGAGHRPGRGIFVPGNTAAGKENDQMLSGSFFEIAMELRAVAGDAVRKRNAVPAMRQKGPRGFRNRRLTALLHDGAEGMLDDASGVGHQLLGAIRELTVAVLQMTGYGAAALRCGSCTLCLLSVAVSGSLRLCGDGFSGCHSFLPLTFLRVPL